MSEAICPIFLLQVDEGGSRLMVNHIGAHFEASKTCYELVSHCCKGVVAVASAKTFHKVV